MTNPAARAKALNELLDGCLHTLAASIGHDEIILVADDLPEKLRGVLDEHIADPEHAAETRIAMGIAMEDFGARLFRRLLAAGLHLSSKQKGPDTDLDYNRRDLRLAEGLLSDLMVECINTPIIPKNVAALLGRVAGSLHDVREGRKPSLFDLPERVDEPLEPRIAETAATQSEGRLAAALEIVILGGTKRATAKVWLEDEMRQAGLVDAAGNPIRGDRVEYWRHNFNNFAGGRSARAHKTARTFNFGPGAANARRWFRIEIEDNFNQALKRDPAACQQYSRRLIRLLATISNRTIRPPLSGLRRVK